MSWLKKLLGITAPINGSDTTDPTSPAYVPTPKAKVPGHMHPGVAHKLANPVRGKARGTGIVYDAAGRPKLTKDWLDNLPPAERTLVDENLAAHGWRVSPEHTVERI